MKRPISIDSPRKTRQREFGQRVNAYVDAFFVQMVEATNARCAAINEEFRLERARQFEQVSNLYPQSPTSAARWPRGIDL